jgi:hypothetical protein
MFFTVAEYNSINGATSNLTSTYATVNNFNYTVDGRDSITYYVAVKGDANSTGFKMARLTPIKIVNQANAKKYIIDQTVSYDNPTLDKVEINMPKITVESGNLVNVPVKVLTNGKSLGALQLDLKYDTSYLEFKNIEMTEKLMKWTAYTNPSGGIVSWGGADLTNINLLVDGEQAFTLQFIAKKPQDSWATAAIWTSEKYVGDDKARDMVITPTMGIVEVRRKGTVTMKDISSMLAFPNPTVDYVEIHFKVEEESQVDLSLYNEVGQLIQTILHTKMPKGSYQYTTNLERLSNGTYILVLKTNKQQLNSKLLII